MSQCRVLIVDDSSIVRKLLKRILQSDPAIEVVGTAADPYIAREKIVSLKPDVMTLDLEMPKMDGITFLSKLTEHHPVRTIVISSLTQKNSELALRALEVGALDVLEKPSIDLTEGLDAISTTIIEKVKAISKARAPEKQRVLPKSTTPSLQLNRTTHQILAIASSTGGTQALREFLYGMPADLPGTVIVQHMPKVFTANFAKSLNKEFPFEVREAKGGDRVLPGVVLLAPGNYHMELTRSGAYYHVRLHQKDPLHGVRPAADYLMKSVAQYAGSNAIGVVLTGMGKDGAEGLLKMKEMGAHVIAQDENTSVVFGMPKAAIDLDAVHEVQPLEKIADAVIRQLRKKGNIAA